MPGVRIEISTNEARVAITALRSDLSKLGLAAGLTEKDAKGLENRLLTRMGADKAKEATEGLTRSLGLTRAEMIKMQMGAGQAAGAFRTLGSGIKTGMNAIFSLKAAFISLGIGMVTRAITKEYSALQLATIDMAKVTTKSFVDLRRDVESLPKSLGTSAQLMGGYYEIMSAGVQDTAKAFDILRVSAMASKSAHIDQGEVVKGMTSILDAYEGKVKDATAVSDFLFKTEALGKVKFQDLIPVIGDVASMAATVGVSLYELGGALAYVSQYAGDTAEATTQVESLMVGLIKPLPALTALLKDFGGAQKAIKDVGLEGTLKIIQERTKGNLEVLTDLLGRKEAALAFMALSRNAFKNFHDLTAQIADSAGLSNRAFELWRNSFEGVMTTYKGTLAKVFVDLGEVAVPQLEAALKALTSSLMWLSQNFQDVYDKMKMLVTVVIEMYAFSKLPALFQLGSSALLFFKSQLIFTAADFDLVTAAGTRATTMLISMRMSAIWAAGGLKVLQASFLVFTAFIAGWQLGSYMFKHFESIRLLGYNFVKNLLIIFESIKYGLKNVIDVIKSSFSGMFKMLGGVLLDFAGLVGKAIGYVPGLEEFGTKITSFVDDLKSKLGEPENAAMLKVRMELNKHDFDRNVDEIKTTFDELAAKTAEEFRPLVSKGLAKRPGIPYVAPTPGPGPTGKNESDKQKEAIQAVADEYTKIQSERLQTSGETLKAELSMVDAWSKEYTSKIGGNAVALSQIEEITGVKKAGINKKYNDKITDEYNQALGSRKMTAVEAYNFELSSLETMTQKKITAVAGSEAMMTKVTETGALARQAINDKYREQAKSSLSSLGFDWAGYEEFKLQKTQETADLIFAATGDTQGYYATLIEGQKNLEVEKNQFILDNNYNLIDSLSASWKIYFGNQKSMNSQFATLSTQIWDQFVSGVGSAIAQTLVYGESFAQTMKALYKTVAATIIQALVQIGVVKLAQWIFGMTLNTTEASARAATLAMETYMGAFAATACIPVYGPAAAPFVAGAALAEVLTGAPIAAAGGAMVGAASGALHGGMTDVPEDQSFLLKKGERVIQPEQNKDLKRFLELQETGKKTREVRIDRIDIPISFPNITNVDQLYNMNRYTFEETIAKTIQEGIRRGIYKGVEVYV